MSPNRNPEADPASLSMDRADPGDAILKVRRIWQARGPFGAALAIAETFAKPIIRLRRRLVFMAHADEVRSPSEWGADEHVFIVGANNLTDLTPGVRAFLATEDQKDDLLGLENGNKLFLVTDGTEGLHRGYVRLVKPSAHDGKAVFFGGLEEIPEIRSCETATQARGRGLYRRVLNEQLRYLRGLGYDKAVLYVMGENTASIKGVTAAGFRLHRTLNDWILFNLVVFQHIREGGSARWRIFLR